MAKWCGNIGFEIVIEDSPSVYNPHTVERFYYGDSYSLSKRYQNSNEINDNTTISSVISIIADPFAFANLARIKYISFFGSNWKISDISVEYPRLKLTLGGLYNG